MLLPTMTYKEMYDNLSKDLKKVKIREDYFLPKAMKEFKKEIIIGFFKLLFIHGFRRFKRCFGQFAQGPLTMVLRKCKISS